LKTTLVFDHELAKRRDDVVLAHLNHRLLQMSLRPSLEQALEARMKDRTAGMARLLRERAAKEDNHVPGNRQSGPLAQGDSQLAG